MTGLPYKRTIVKFFGILALSLLLIGSFLPIAAQALSCLSPEDVIAKELAEESNGLVFTGTVTEISNITSNLTENTVVVETAHKGNVPAVVQIRYSYSEDWGYGCGAGPSQVGQTKTFFVNPRSDGTYNGGLALTAGSARHDLFLAEVTNQQPLSSIVGTTTVGTQPTPSFWQRAISAFENFWNGLFADS